MIDQFKEIFGSRMKALEILYLLKEIKPVVRHGFYPHELERVKKFCDKNNLFLEKSPYKIVLNDKERFTNKGKIVKPKHPKGMFLVYISKHHLKALWACLYETRQDHRNTGIMLGYPSCCVEFFVREFNKGNFNPVHKPTNQWANLLLRDNDVALLSHFPCSNECQASIEIAKKNFNLIKKYDEKLANLFHERLAVKTVTGT